MGWFLLWHLVVAVLTVGAFALYGWPISNLLFLLLGVVGTQLAWPSWRDWFEQRRYSIGGDYEAISTDVTPLKGELADAQGRVHRHLNLIQHGKRVEGTEKPQPEAKNDTAWKFAGEISGDCVLGTWEKVSPPGTANRGTFDMRVPHVTTGQFDGYWTGWDPAKGRSSHGEYVWVRKPADKQSLPKRVRTWLPF